MSVKPQRSQSKLLEGGKVNEEIKQRERKRINKFPQFTLIGVLFQTL